jgi:hypothetical protein|tara:strand:+ start:76 stop:405 length:330 start_codon:yes stop_codon:yes gene_type:complete
VYDLRPQLQGLVFILDISHSVVQKLRQKHDISVDEVEECFLNRTHGFLIDKREEHKTDPPTYWFIAETDLGRKLKICMIIKSDKFVIKTAFRTTNQDLIEMYYRKSKKE